MSIIIEEVDCWMDGGSVTLKVNENELSFYDVEFVQKVYLKHTENCPKPGSLLLNGKEVDIRSELEQELLAKLKVAVLGSRIREREKELSKMIISEAIAFVESNDYIEVAKKLGRISES